jgi:hypothetical protein
MELYDILVNIFDSHKTLPEPPLADPEIPLTVFLSCLELARMPIKDRATFPILPVSVNGKMSMYMVRNSVIMSQAIEDSFLTETQPGKSPLALALCKLSFAISTEITTYEDFVPNSEMLSLLCDKLLGAKTILTDEKSSTENEETMKYFQKTYKTRLTLADLVEMSEVKYAEMLLQAAEHSAEMSDTGIISDLPLVDAAAAAFEKFLSTTESSDVSWYRASKIYHMMGPTTKVSTIEETSAINTRVENIFKRNLQAVKNYFPPDALREAWTTFDYAMTRLSGEWQYTEVKALVERGNECMAACKSWTPPYFIKNLIEGVDLLEKLLIAAERMYPSDYKTRQLGMEVLSALEPSEMLNFDLSDPNPRRRCSTCGEESMTLSACSRCKKAYYCNAVCQKKHWKVHKKTCYDAGGAFGEAKPS